MSRLLLAILLTGLMAGAAWAACTNVIEYRDGKQIVCQVCCDPAGQCITTCF